MQNGTGPRLSWPLSWRFHGRRSMLSRKGNSIPVYLWRLKLPGYLKCRWKTSFKMKWRLDTSEVVERLELRKRSHTYLHYLSHPKQSFNHCRFPQSDGQRTATSSRSARGMILKPAFFQQQYDEKDNYNCSHNGLAKWNDFKFVPLRTFEEGVLPDIKAIHGLE